MVVPQPGRKHIYSAASAQLVGVGGDARLELSNCNIFRPQPGDNVTTQYSNTVSVALTAHMLRPPPAQRKAMTIRELVEKEKQSARDYASSTSRSNAEDLRAVRTEISDRITLPFACLAVSLAVAPLAVRAPRGGRSYSFAIGIALLGGYYLLRILLEAKSVHPLEDYVIRGLAPNVALGLIGLWALWRVDRV